MTKKEVVGNFADGGSPGVMVTSNGQKQLMLRLC